MQFYAVFRTSYTSVHFCIVMIRKVDVPVAVGPGCQAGSVGGASTGCQHRLVCGGTQVTRWQGSPYAQRLLLGIRMPLRCAIRQIAPLRESARRRVVDRSGPDTMQKYGSSPTAAAQLPLLDYKLTCAGLTAERELETATLVAIVAR